MSGSSLLPPTLLDPPPLASTRRVQLAWQQPVAQSLHYETRLAWAAVHDPASGADLQTLGSRQSVRGFDAQDFLTGQQQITWRQDLRWDWFSSALLAGLQLQPYLGLDCGRIAAVAPPAAPGVRAGRVLAGGVAGLRWRAPGLSGDLALAVPLHKPDDFVASPAVIYASLNLNY